MASIFLSYATVDREKVDRIREDLESRNYSTWMDHCKIRGGQEWETEIATNLARCEIFLVNITEASNKSKWVRRETILAENLKKKRIPLLLGGEIPFRLLDVQCVDFRKSYKEGISKLLEILETSFSPSQANDSFGAVGANFLCGMHLKKKDKAKVHKVRMPSKTGHQQEKRKKKKKKPNPASIPAVDQDEEPTCTEQTIKKLLFCVPHGWLEGSAPSAEQVKKDKKFVCKALAKLDKVQGETDASKHAKIVRKFFDSILDHMEDAGRQFRSRITTVEPTGTLVLRLRVNKKDVSLDFVPNSKNHQLLLECVDGLMGSLYGNNSSHVFLSGSWPGSVCILMRAPEASTDSLFNRWKEEGSGELELGGGFTLLGMYHVFSAGVMGTPHEHRLKWVSSEDTTPRPRDRHHYFCTALGDVLDSFLAATGENSGYTAESTQVDFMAYKVDKEDAFFFLVPSNMHSIDMFLEEESDCWTPVGPSESHPAIEDLEISDSKPAGVVDIASTVPSTEMILPSGDFDILSGGGKEKWNSPGNQQFKQLAHTYAIVYADAASKDERSRIVESVVEAISRMGGRFLKQDYPDAPWYEMDKSERCQKVAHTICGYLATQTNALAASSARPEMPSIFLSYATVDRDKVDRIRKDLESRHYSTWMDHSKTRGGPEWEKEIATKIERCDIFLVCVTGDYNKSDWVKREVLLAENLQKTRLILLLEHQIPFRLLVSQVVDFRDSYEAGISNLLEALEAALNSNRVDEQSVTLV